MITQHRGFSRRVCWLRPRPAGGADLEDGGSPDGDYPIISLAELIAAAEDDALEVADEERHRYCVKRGDTATTLEITLCE